ncbi:MAG: hypothetical protein M1837_001396 [Sclerophora amabilis]|nr:MAG: hypothetical protein M1837_001396 [Sclerophora amabilis]
MDEETLLRSSSDYLADAPPTVVRLEIKSHFEALNEDQRRYAHYISRAGFLGTRIILRQVSPESESIFDLILALHRHANPDELVGGVATAPAGGVGGGEGEGGGGEEGEGGGGGGGGGEEEEEGGGEGGGGGVGSGWKNLQQKANITDDELQGFLEYAVQFLGNLGNYKAIGDVKFVPRISEAAFTALVWTVPEAVEHYQKTEGRIFASEQQQQQGLMHLGYIDEGHVSAYFPDSPSITKEEITLIGDFTEAMDFSLINTRLRKTSSGGDFEILIPSANMTAPAPEGGTGVTEWDLEGKLKGRKLRLVYGDHSKEMAKIADALESAAQFAGNETQRQMLHEYVETFRTGSVEAFKQSQRYWIRDKGPTVETNIGFIENYRDPHGVRAEWEGWVAMVNQERTKAFSRLVAGAEAMIPKLPWPADFETDKFLSPDFTSLEVLSIAASMIPAGINIPNFDDTRQNEGFKNVSLGNVLSAKAPDEKIHFLSSSDLPVFKANRDGAFEVQVGIHELLGHGTGKLLQETSPGTYNFDIHNPPVSPVTNKSITTWYKPGQTWGSVFGSLSSSYEECRAECVAMALSCDFSILEAFNFGDGTEEINGPAGDALYVCWLQMARAGLLALEFYDPASKKWGQAHAQGRFSILRCFLEDAGPDFARLVYSSPDDLSDLHVSLDRQKILSHGRPAVERYLQKLHIYKTTADIESGKALYERMTRVDDEWWGGKVRDEVLKRKAPRKVFVQANTVLDRTGADVIFLREYEASLQGMITSWAERKV